MIAQLSDLEKTALWGWIEVPALALLAMFSVIFSVWHFVRFLYPVLKETFEAALSKRPGVEPEPTVASNPKPFREIDLEDDDGSKP